MRRSRARRIDKSEDAQAKIRLNSARLLLLERAIPDVFGRITCAFRLYTMFQCAGR
jgi:hypothetical protein